jgi:polyribonucleotide nucleotidyltransferase
MSSSLRDADALSRTVVRKSYTIGTKNISLETGRLALFADGAVVIEDTDGNFLLTTAGIGAAKDADFFPMSVEFQEKYYAAGKIGGNRFMKREGRPSDGSILNSRMIDRPIRPMFPKGTRTEVQIISTIMSSSGVSDFGWYGITGASLSLMLAGVEGFEGPVAGVRICSDVDGNFIFDPTFDQIRTAHLDLTVAGTLDAITMVESQGQQVENALMVRAFEYAHTMVKQLCSAQIDFVAEYTKVYTLRTTSLKVVDTNPEVYTIVAGRLKDADIQTVYGL